MPVDSAQSEPHMRTLEQNQKQVVAALQEQYLANAADPLLCGEIAGLLSQAISDLCSLRMH